MSDWTYGTTRFAISLAALVLVACTGPPAGGDDDGGDWTLGEDAGPEADASADDAGGPSDDGGGVTDPESTTFVLENRAEETMEIVEPSHCQGTEEAWVSVFDGDEQVNFDTDCTICACEEAREGLCPICDMACVPGETRELGGGETQAYQWNHVGHVRREVGGQQCHDETRFEPGEELTARFCWTEPYGRGGRQAETTRCTEKQFTPGDGEVRQVIEPFDSPAGATFRLENDSGGPIRVQKTENCYEEPPGWMSVEQDGEQKQLVDRCGTCSCEKVETGDGCAVCLPECVPETIEEIPAGEATSWTWSGYLYESDEVDGRTCTRRRTMTGGEGLQVELCWSEGSGPTGTVGTLEEETCSTQPFVYTGSEQEFSYSVGSE